MANNKNNKPEDEQGLSEQRRIRREKLAELQAAGRDPFKITKWDQEQRSAEIKENFDKYEDKQVSIAGRIMSKRIMGKASFIDLLDRDGKIQCFVARDNLGADEYAIFKKYDVGDIVGVKGEVFKTKTGEITVRVKELVLLSKSLQVLPEKFHGLQDTDMRYRQRYVDLIMNPEVRDTFRKRSQIISAIRKFLAERDFMEVETPILVTNAGGAAARPFETHHNALDEDFRLRISLELYLKRLIVGGLERVFEIGRVFRNEGLDPKHNPEFTLMELYQAYTDFHGMMELSESLYRYVAQEVLGTTVIQYADREIDLGKPFERMTMTEAVKKYSGVDFSQIKTIEEARAAADSKGVEYEQRHEIGDILNLFFDEFVEKNLIQPTFITEHPVEISPLTKKKPDDPEHVERFELFINGWELANAYSELNDPIDQRERFQEEERRLAAGDDEANHTDEDFLNALEIGMPPTGGIGFGIDRMIMLMTDSSAIRDVLLFPTMKPLGGKNKTGKKEETPKLDAGISCEEAMDLLRKYNEDPFHITHGEMVGKLMRYYAEKYDPKNADFWQVVGILHDLDWEKWQDSETHTVKTAELLKEAGVNPQVAHSIQTHNSDNNSDLPKPELKMERVLWAVDELSGLLGAVIKMYPSHSAQDLNLKSVKKKYKNKKFAAGCDREYIEKGAELNGMDIEELLASVIEAAKAVDLK
ncbi:MAG: lysine--tRNA ligase [Anaerovoracaceae bacterium]|jgi:lysyl-tRNA synthetase class 2